MKILCIDVGIRNLAWCIIDSDVWKKYSKKTKERGVVNWGRDDMLNPQHPVCGGVKKNGDLCGKLASYTAKIKNKKPIIDPQHVCGTHAKFKREIRKEYKKGKKRATMKSYTLAQISDKLIDWLEENQEWLCDVDEVYIELQVTKNRKMILVSNTIYTWFRIQKRNLETLKTVKFLSAKYKLSWNVYQSLGVKRDRKKLRKKENRKSEAIDLVPDIIKFDLECKRIFSESNKKDDLADTLLMCMYICQKYHCDG